MYDKYYVYYTFRNNKYSFEINFIYFLTSGFALNLRWGGRRGQKNSLKRPKYTKEMFKTIPGEMFPKMDNLIDSVVGKILKD